MLFEFYKYQGTGNDFVIIDNRTAAFDATNQNLIAKICDRRFGIGADGFMLLEHAKDAQDDFKMVYFNADGNESTMCGNGGRCLVAFAHHLGIFEQETHFMAIDGRHYARMTSDKQVCLQMIDMEEVQHLETHSFLDTGSPHHVQQVSHLEIFDVYTEGKNIRYGAPYFEKGTNVNFVEQFSSDTFKVRTYERGVEDETLACGTGVTAVAIAMYDKGITTHENLLLKVEGGELQVRFLPLPDNRYTDVFLTGPAELVFKGVYTI